MQTAVQRLVERSRVPRPAEQRIRVILPAKFCANIVFSVQINCKVFCMHFSITLSATFCADTAFFLHTYCKILQILHFCITLIATYCANIAFSLYTNFKIVCDYCIFHHTICKIGPISYQFQNCV